MKASSINIQRASMYTDQESGRQLLSPGAERMLMLAAGQEIHCASGSIRIVAPTMMADGSMAAPAWLLATGQSWRAGEAAQVTLRNEAARASIIVLGTRVQFSAGPKENRLAALAARRLHEAFQWIRRGPIAASAKTP